MNSEEGDRELRRLWALCASDRATEVDWTALYHFVRRVLTQCNVPALSKLPEERSVYVDEYFNQRIFLGMRPGLRGPDHCGALILFFRRYLLTVLSGSNSVSLSPENMSPGEDEGMGAVLDDNPDPSACHEPFKDVDRILAEECGKSVAQVSSAALKFLAALKAEDTCAWLLLSEGFCPDAGEKVPISQLAKARGIKSAHYRASQLGINHQWDSGLDSFKDTTLGNWLEETLGRALSANIRDSVWGALEILCFHALTDQER